MDPNATNILFPWDPDTNQFDVAYVNIFFGSKDEEGRHFQTNLWFSKNVNPNPPIIPDDPDLKQYVLEPDILPSGFYKIISYVPAGWWSVDDDVAIYLNGEIIFQDNNIATDAFPPLTFWAKTGDQLRITSTDSAGSCRYLTPLKISSALNTLSLSGTSIPQVCDHAVPSTTPFFDRTYTLP